MINRVVLVGRITRDPEVQQTNTGIPYVRFSLACNRPFKNQSGERQADFINLIAWGKTAEFITKYFNKGDMIAVRGSLQTRSYEKDGVKRTLTEVLVDKVSFCGGKVGKKEEPKEEIDPFEFGSSDDDDCPF